MVRSPQIVDKIALEVSESMIENVLRKMLFKTIMLTTDIVYYMEEDAMVASRSLIDRVIEQEIRLTMSE
jgi:hypothetical protein